MDTQHETTEARRRGPGSAFRRVGATVAVACAVTGSIAGLGAMGALAAPGSSPAASSGQEAAPAPKVVYTHADLAAFAASPYADDALNLAVVWGVDVATAQGKAGAKITTGTDLPFGVDEAETASYTADQQQAAYYANGTTDTWASDFTQVLGLALAWGSPTIADAKAKAGGLLLEHESVPAAPATYTDDEKARAFSLVRYGDAEAAQLAGLWQVDTRTATVRAGAALLVGDDLPL